MKKILIGASLFVSITFFAQSFETTAHPKVSEIQKNFRYKKYPKPALEEFSKLAGAEPNEAIIMTECIPGEIISWRNDRGSFSTSQHFRIEKTKLREILTIPESNDFLANLEKYAPTNHTFEFNAVSGRTYDPEFIKKQKNGKYLLTVNLVAIKKGSVNGNDLYELEYETSDFKTFKPLRIKNTEEQNSKWQTIN
ncbi:hypothetical protein [Chryseobacterium vaccae]|uniref:hypothetical protein n=1 Tax=Chryseobacterium vaccae TaxID=2604424 RepID=UPI00129792B6|nr:hypothetical protein [Chryseobacterium vaccae]